MAIRNKARGGALLASAVAGLALAPAARAQLQLTPTLELHESWSDNPALSSNGAAHSQLITEVSPGFTVSEHSSRLQLRASYKLNLFEYSDRRLSGNDRVNQELALAVRPDKAAMPRRLARAEPGQALDQGGVGDAGAVGQVNPRLCAHLDYLANLTKSPFSATPDMMAPSWHSNSVWLDITFSL